MRGVAILIGAALLAGCTMMQDTADQIARQQARGVVNAEMQARFPGANAEPLTDCVIDNASAQEILTIAGGVALGQSDAATNTISAVLQRPDTARCAARAYSGGALDGLLEALS